MKIDDLHGGHYSYNEQKFCLVCPTFADLMVGMAHESGHGVAHEIFSKGDNDELYSSFFETDALYATLNNADLPLNERAQAVTSYVQSMYFELTMFHISIQLIDGNNTFLEKASNPIDSLVACVMEGIPENLRSEELQKKTENYICAYIKRNFVHDLAHYGLTRVIALIEYQRLQEKIGKSSNAAKQMACVSETINRLACAGKHSAYLFEILTQESIEKAMRELISAVTSSGIITEEASDVCPRKSENSCCLIY